MRPHKDYEQAQDYTNLIYHSRPKIEETSQAKYLCVTIDDKLT